QAAAIGAGGWHSFAVLASGGVKSWGANGHGQLGDGTATYRSVPTAVLDLVGAVSIAGGDTFSIARTHYAETWCWGLGSFLGLVDFGAASKSMVPSRVAGAGHTVVGVTAGRGHAVSMRSDGSVWTWGNNDLGQLASGAFTA